MNRPPEPTDALPRMPDRRRCTKRQAAAIRRLEFDADCPISVVEQVRRFPGAKGPEDLTQTEASFVLELAISSKRQAAAYPEDWITR